MAETVFTDMSATQNRVLRNTYWLLALSLLPTIAGAWAGVAFGFSALLIGSPILSFVLFLAVAFGFIFAINATKDSALGVPILLAFTFFMGLIMSPLIGTVLGMKNGVSLVSLAAGGTALIFAVMAIVSSTLKRDISGWGKYLTIGVVCLIVAMLANMWFKLPLFALIISVIAVVIFSAFLLYDLKRIVDGGETNYVMATLAIYLDLVNIFQNLLAVLGLTAGNDD